MFRLSSKAKANPVFAVWIQPTPITGLRQISSHAFWSVKQSNEFLELLEHVTTPKQTSLFSDIVQSVRALNPLDANPHQFRLLLRVRGSGGPAFIVAESSRLDNILLHWEHLMRLLAQCGEHVLDAHDKVTFLVSKVAALVTEQDEGRGLASLKQDDDVPEHAAKLFRDSFPALVQRGEQLISYFYGTLHSGAVPVKCTLFACVATVALHCSSGVGVAAADVTLAWTDVTSVTKQSVLLLLDTGVAIATSDGRKLVFVTVRRDECYALLDQLWNKQIALLHESVESQARGMLREVSDDGGSTTTPTTTSRHALEKARQYDLWRRALHLPSDEKIVYTFNAQLSVPAPKPGNVIGTALVTSNAFCFLSEGVRQIALVLPFARITGVEETSSFIGLIQTGFTVATSRAAFKFTALTRDLHLKQLHTQQALCLQKRSVAAASHAPVVDALIDRFGRRRWAATAEGGGDLAFQAQQLELERAWAEYFMHNGVSSDLCVIRRQAELLELSRRGCPNELRSNVWSVLSGAAFLSEREPGLFQRLLAERGGEETRATREIATDLNRSSTHAFFLRNPEAHESLRRVLVAFSLRNTQLGYCQGLNIIAAFLLLYMCEEEAFWQLTLIAEQLLPGYFDANLSGARADQEVFSMLVQHFMPKLHKHLLKIDLGLNVISLAWFMVLFVGYVPDVAAARVLDCLFVDGADVLFQVALAKLAHAEQALLDSADMSIAMDRVRNDVVLDADGLLQVAFDRFGTLPHDKMEAVRAGQRLASVRGREQSVRDTTCAETLKEARLEFGSVVTRQEIAALFDVFSSHTKPGSVGLALDYDAFARIFPRVCGGVFDAEIAADFHVVDDVSDTAAAAAAPVAPGEVQRRSMRDAFLGVSRQNESLITFREFVALTCLFKFGTVSQQFRFWMAASKNELFSRDDVRCIAATVLHAHFADIGANDVDTVVQILFHKAASHSLRSSQQQCLENNSIDAHMLEELMVQQKLLENFVAQMEQMYKRRVLVAPPLQEGELAIAKENDEDDF
jgi:hypothetical protein